MSPLKSATFRAMTCLAIWALTGCDALTFTPDEEPFTEVQPATGDEGQFRILQDTVGLFRAERYDDPPEITYVFDGDAEAGLRFEAFLDDEPIEIEQSHFYKSLQINANELPDGLYTFRLKVFAPSPTGSLSERYGLIAEIERPALVDNRAPYPPVLLTAKPEGGVLTLRWEPYRRFNFQRYAIYEVGYPEDSSPRFLGYIFDADTPVWRDSSYALGERQYRVEVRAAGQTAWRGALDIEYPGPEILSVASLEGNQHRVVWESTPFHSSFESYSLVGSDGYTVSVVAALTSPSDTSVVVEDADRWERYQLQTWTADGTAWSQWVSLSSL